MGRGVGRDQRFTRFALVCQSFYIKTPEVTVKPTWWKQSLPTWKLTNYHCNKRSSVLNVMVI